MSRRSQDVVKEGFLCKCPQKQGLLKKWNRRFFVLFQQSSRETARLEYYDDEWSYGRAENKRIIPLRDSEGVYQVPGDKNNPYAFEIKTPVAVHRLAAQSQPDLEAWMKQIKRVVQVCQEGAGSLRRASSGASASGGTAMTVQAQPRQSHHPPVVTATPTDNMAAFGDPFQYPSSGHAAQVPLQPSTPASPATSMVPNSAADFSENTVYTSVEEDYRIRVRIKRTDASFRQGLAGDMFLVLTANSLQLHHIATDQVLASWPLRYIRRYGRDMKKFSFEGGRRCGELAGIFELETDKGNEIFNQCQQRIKALEEGQHKALNPSSFSQGSAASQRINHTTSAGSLELPTRPTPYRERTSEERTAVTSGFATISGRGRMQRSSADSLSASASPPAHNVGATMPRNFGSNTSGPLKPARTRTKSSETAPQLTRQDSGAYSHLSREQQAATALSLSGSQHQDSEPEINSQAYTTVPDSLAESLAERMKRPNVVPRTTPSRDSSRPTSLGSGFDAVNKDMTNFDKELEMLEEQLQGFPDLDATSPVTPGSQVDGRSQATSPISPTSPSKAPLAAAKPPVARKKANPFLSSPSVDNEDERPSQSAKNPFGTPASSSTSGDMAGPPLPGKRRMSATEPFAQRSPAHPASPKEGDASLGSTAAAKNYDVFTEDRKGGPKLPPKRQASLRGKNASAARGKNTMSLDGGQGGPPPVPRGDYEKYDKFSPPLPAAVGGGSGMDNGKYNETTKPPLPAGGKPVNSGGAGAPHDEDTDKYGYTRHVQTNAVSPDSSGDEGNGAPGVPRPDYDSVEVNTKAPVADVAVGKPKVASRSTGYNNIPAQPEPPNLQSVKLRKTSGSTFSDSPLPALPPGPVDKTSGSTFSDSPLPALPPDPASKVPSSTFSDSPLPALPPDPASKVPSSTFSDSPLPPLPPDPESEDPFGAGPTGGRVNPYTNVPTQGNAEEPYRNVPSSQSPDPYNPYSLPSSNAPYNPYSMPTSNAPKNGADPFAGSGADGPYTNVPSGQPAQEPYNPYSLPSNLPRQAPSGDGGNPFGAGAVGSDGPYTNVVGAQGHDAGRPEQASAYSNHLLRNVSNQPGAPNPYANVMRGGGNPSSPYDGGQAADGPPPPVAKPTDLQQQQHHGMSKYPSRNDPFSDLTKAETSYEPVEREDGLAGYSDSDEENPFQ